MATHSLAKNVDSESFSKQYYILINVLRELNEKKNGSTCEIPIKINSVKSFKLFDDNLKTNEVSILFEIPENDIVSIGHDLNKNSSKVEKKKQILCMDTSIKSFSLFSSSLSSSSFETSSYSSTTSSFLTNKESLNKKTQGRSDKISIANAVNTNLTKIPIAVFRFLEPDRKDSILRTSEELSLAEMATVAVFLSDYTGDNVQKILKNFSGVKINLTSSSVHCRFVFIFDTKGDDEQQHHEDQLDRDSFSKPIRFVLFSCDEFSLVQIYRDIVNNEEQQT